MGHPEILGSKMQLLLDKSKRFQMKAQPGDKDQVMEQDSHCL